jgi:hypothetical protein
MSVTVVLVWQTGGIAPDETGDYLVEYSMKKNDILPEHEVIHFDAYKRQWVGRPAPLAWAKIPSVKGN